MQQRYICNRGGLFLISRPLALVLLVLLFAVQIPNLTMKIMFMVENCCKWRRSVHIYSSLHILHIFTCSVVYQLPGQFTTKIKQIRNNLGVFCRAVKKAEYNESVDLHNREEESEDLNGELIIVQVPSMLGIACHRLLWSSNAWQ